MMANASSPPNAPDKEATNCEKGAKRKAPVGLTGGVEYTHSEGPRQRQRTLSKVTTDLSCSSCRLYIVLR